MIWLCTLLTEHRDALEYDLISHGKSIDDIGTPGLSWRDLLVIVTQQPRTSALARVLEPAAHAWGLPEQLLAGIYDLLKYDLWRNSDPKKRGPEPRPLMRPGITPPTVDKIPSTSLTRADFDRLMKERQGLSG
jgi:hypothetical protein